MLPWRGSAPVPAASKGANHQWLFQGSGLRQGCSWLPRGICCWCGWCPSRWGTGWTMTCAFGGGEGGEGGRRGHERYNLPTKSRKDENCIWCQNVSPSPSHLPLLSNHLKSPCPSQVPTPPPHAPAGSPPIPNWCQPLARAIGHYASWLRLSPARRPSQPCKREAIGSSPEWLGGTRRLLAPPGQAAHLCLQWPVAVAAEDGHGAGTGMPEAGSTLLPPLPLAASEPADPTAPSLLLYPPGAQGPSCSWRELPLVTQLQTAQGYF